MQTIINAVFSACHSAVSAAMRAAVLFLLVSVAIPAVASVARAESGNGSGNPDTRPVVYLTFDDGPSADTVTDEVLRILAKHDATATFFVTGQRVRREHDKIAEIVYAGHAIGNHTLNHAKLTLVSDEEVMRELRVANEVILAAGGPPPTCFRPPFGSTDSRINGLASRLGMAPVGWSIDTRDWEKSTSITAISGALDRISRDSVVLLHDGPSYRGKMLFALSSWMESEAHRFRFHALPECSSGSAVVQLAEVRDTTPVITKETESVKQQAAPVLAEAPVTRTLTTIPELLNKIRSYQFVLHEKGRRVDLTQVTAELDTEFGGDLVFYSF